jgi:flagellar hook-associated protein 3 FlgL
MFMRVTERQQVDSLVTALQKLRSNIFERTEQISSGKRVNRPSDDPIAAERITQFRNLLRTTDRRLTSVNEGAGRLNLSESVLNEAGNSIQRAKELALRMRNDTNSAGERRNAALEVQHLIEGLAGIGNTVLNGRFLFAGSQTQTAPFIPGSVTDAAHTGNTGGATIATTVGTPSALQSDAYQIQFTSPTNFDVLNFTTGQTVLAGQTYVNGTPFSFDGVDVTLADTGTPPATGDEFVVRVGFQYQGDDAAVDIEIGDGQTVTTNVAGAQVFSGPTADVFQNLQDFQRALLTNDVAGIETAIGQLDPALTQINDARASIGARVNRLDTVKESLDLLTVNTETIRSSFEDTDFAKVASELTSLQLTLEASLATLTRQFNTSLLNFL